jgi:outer membrane protein assembly factor BamB
LLPKIHSTILKILLPMKTFMSLLMAVAGGLVADGANWSNWRGPDGLGVSRETDLPIEWSTEKNVLWKAEIPGMGTSSPSVHGNRVYVTTQTDDDGLHVLAIDVKTGTVDWKRRVASGRLPTHNLHNMATPTPVTNGTRIWAHFGTGDLVCLDYNGNTVWTRNLVTDYGAYNTNHGMGNSPMLVDGKLFIACMHQGPSYLLALDPESGRTLWKTDRNPESEGEAMDSYSSPLVVRMDDRTLIVLSGADHLDAYDPETGEQVWVSSGLQVPHPYGRTISGPAFGEGTVVTVASGFRNQGFVIAVNPSLKGEITSTGRLWETRRYAPDCPCPLVYRGMVFMIRDDGMASCLDLRTGEPFWQERLFSQNIKVSPVAADGKIYFSSGEGECKVVEAAPELKILAHNDLEEYMIASPALSNRKVFLRTASTLYCIGHRD